MVRKQARSTRMSAWPPGTWLPPDLGVCRNSPHDSHSRWQDPTRTHALLHSIHSTIGGTE